MLDQSNPFFVMLPQIANRSNHFFNAETAEALFYQLMNQNRLLAEQNMLLQERI